MVRYQKGSVSAASALKHIIIAFVLALVFSALGRIDPVSGLAKQSTLTMTTSADTLPFSITPLPGGQFGSTANNTITVTTDNFTGYTLSVASSSSRSMLNANDDAVTSISSAIDETTFSSSSTYNNQFGYKPSQYVTTSGGVNTTNVNSNYLPVPSTTGDLLAVTSAANSSADSYTISFGARVDTTLPAGSYTYTYVITAVANSIVYNVTYDDNTNETVNSMPSPNPQAFTIDGGTPVAQSYGVLSNALPVMTSGEKTFGGWCDVATTYNSFTQNDECDGTTYQPGDTYLIDQTVDGTNIILYAIWEKDPFPVVWSQMGKCIFDGASNDTDSDPDYVQGNIHGTECQAYTSNRFIDTGIALYSNRNYRKDYEVHFTIDKYISNDQPDTQSTLFNDKLSSSVIESPYEGHSPGIVVRRSGTAIELKSTYTTTPKTGQEYIRKSGSNAYAGTDVRIFRINGVIYTSIDNGPITELQNMTNPAFAQQFGLSAWFGGYPDNVDCTENCTQAKRFLEGELSNMYIKLGNFDESNLHEIIFDENYGNNPTTTTYLIMDGDSVSPLPTATRADWVFGGWWTAATGGTERTAPYTPTTSERLYAHWYKSVSEAQITNSSLSLIVNDTATIQITNSSNLEPYTFSSSDDSIATVSSAGVVTATGAGLATITMTGTITGDTKTITVSVGGLITVTFDPDYGSEATFTENVADGGSFSSLPTYSRTAYELEGWYTGHDGTGTQLTTSTVFDANTPTTYYANWTQIPYVCKVATSRHSETCDRTDSNGCRKAGWSSGATIEYGYLIQDSSTVTAGAAYDCDVDYDGVYDDETERFYYFGTENGNAKLIHYINQQNNASVAYDVAVSYLPNYEPDSQNPTVPVWDNPNLVTYDSGTFAGKAARFMTYEEVYDLWTGGTGRIKPSDYRSVFLFENSNFASTAATDGIWLQKTTEGNPSNDGKNRIQTSALNLNHNFSTYTNASRATIEVPTEYIQPYTAPPATYTITFDPHNGTSSWDESVTAGDDLSDVYPATDPTYIDHIFQGWYTAATGGSQISSNTEPSGTTTYHAQWLGTVQLATFGSNSISVEEGSTETITVTNSANIENYGFASLDSTVATVDATTGVVTGVAAGSTSIRMTGASSLLYVDIPVTVTAAPVTYTVYFNPHNGDGNTSVTVTAGSTIGSSNIPADPTPTGVDEVFMGWFTAASGGTAVDGTTTPTADGETYHAQYKKIVCKLAQAGTLHSATKVSPNSGVSTYGQIANNSTPQSGDAYNCDVDYDDTYSPVNERFYYLGQDANNNAVLVAWNSYYNDAWAAGTSNDSIFAYTDALAELPDNTSGAWDNPGLIEHETGKAARFTTRAEVASACGLTLNQLTGEDALLVCDYFMEHAKYDGGGRSALWLMKENNTQYRIHTDTGNRHVSTSASGSSMVRPTIVVPDKLIEKYTQPLDVTNAVISNNDLTVMVGQTLAIQVSNSASLEPYTFSSDDASIATVDSSTGVVTGVGVGTVDIIMTGTTSGLTKTIEVEVVTNPDIPVVFDVSNDATRGYQALSAQWAQSPVNIATFNKDTTTINNSTWGDTSELSELQYWTAIRNNFVNNQCFIQTSTANNTNSDAVKPLSALSAWTSGSVDCSKPSAYDTNTNSALTVRLNDAQGAVVAYANADSGVIHNMIPGQTYYWEKTSDSTVYGYVTAVSNGSSTGTRWVDMDVVRNVRDLGGLPVTYTDANNQTVTGTIAYGRLFRGEKMQSVNASVLTNLGITTEYNVGDEYQDDTHLTDYHLNNVIHYDFDYNSGDENNSNSNYMKAWTAVTNIMTDIVDTNSTKNIYFHCRVGADRTGTVAYLLEGLLGVPDEQRYEEYGLTNVSGLYDRTRYYKQKASNNANKFVYMMGYVLTNQDIYNWYMHNPNADTTLIQSFRTAMTVPTQSQSPSPAPSPDSGNGNNQQQQSQGVLNDNTESINNTGNLSNSDDTEAAGSDKNETYSAQNGYTSPLGVSTASNIEREGDASDGSPATTGMAIAAAVVAVTGVASYALAKQGDVE